ncbi:methionine ABC transporter ATP-binding protein [Bifidobacterium primatium]|uniref:Methionine ABC transporter ATP-binding protein n=1 Tax=Bifidobacterium primatium TaxID=2045438 RepID=A0A2M9HAC1_9BIFI|nr:ATP-binding cassette domain-containing protein [Bifidobacterium primatium]PJM73760.1 methionine ABC transporter ATP-binding protein [Bifidobacterium primatium]
MAEEHDAVENDAITLSNVTKTVLTADGPKSLLKDVTLHFEQGGIYGVIGLGGAGKSTLLKLIDGRLTPTSGTVTVLGENLAKLDKPALARFRTQISRAGVFPAFDEERTVLESVAIAAGEAEDADRPDEAARAKALRLLREVSLRSQKDAHPSQLSGGELQRAAVARAFASSPKILLFDEVTAAQDHIEGREILRLIQQFARESGATVVLATHEIATVKEICDHIIVLDRGLVVEEGSTFSVLADPQTDQTRVFMEAVSSLGKVDALLAGHDPVVDLRPGQKLIRLRYVHEDVSEPLVSLITRKFGIDVNIMLADVQIVGKYPIGGIVGVFEGPERNIRDAVAFLRSKKVRVEVLAEN